MSPHSLHMTCPEQANLQDTKQIGGYPKTMGTRKGRTSKWFTACEFHLTQKRFFLFFLTTVVPEKDTWALFLVPGTEVQNPWNGLRGRGIFGSHETTPGGVEDRGG